MGTGVYTDKHDFHQRLLVEWRLAPAELDRRQTRPVRLSLRQLLKAGKDVTLEYLLQEVIG